MGVIGGSPPRLRGAHRLTRGIPRISGITPAPAGSTQLKTNSCHTAWDHPRACGEHYVAHSKHTGSRGSPPRLRGAPFWWKYRLHRRRITPAPAGSTLGSGCLRPLLGDHPRACGEHVRGGARYCGKIGSPPRLRGAHCYKVTCGILQGITPAPAGSTD